MIVYAYVRPLSYISQSFEKLPFMCSKRLLMLMFPESPSFPAPRLMRSSALRPGDSVRFLSGTMGSGASAAGPTAS